MLINFLRFFKTIFSNSRILMLMIFAGCLFSNNLSAQEAEGVAPEFLKYENSKWVDSIMSTLSPDERVAQLIMIAAYSNRDEKHKEETLKLIKEQKVGGVLFFQGDPVRQVKLMNEYQAASKVPLLGAIDAEWGVGMRLDSTVSFPFQMALGAVKDDSLIYNMGAQIARDVKRVGLHMNFALMVDVNNNAGNPVINYRSFGEDKYNVAKKGVAYVKGSQGENVLTTAKHFPGHGDTDVDSHYSLPQINHSFGRLDSLELYPFKELLKAGASGVMVAHLNIPSLDSTGVPSTLSYPTITDLLKKKLKFKGLVVTDAMNMKGVTEGNTPGIVDKDALLAGNDLLEFTEDVPKAIEEIRKAINAGLISQAEIDRRARKILAVKQWVGLDNYKPTPLYNIIEELNSPEVALMNRKLTEASLTVLKNEGDILPVKELNKHSIASLSFGKEEETTFQRSVGLYAGTANFNLPFEASEEEVDSIRALLQPYNMVIAGVHDSSKYPRNNLNLAGLSFISSERTFSKRKYNNCLF
ncbi:glycoside hydrolase family 3 [Antarcticibacterium sp. 1MA-6-2]|uniref:glycoside hydrolase family 3 protein n=1 Tax=Antarcticibacterium sp. 1MA-6-2 TaxID=2908210 RepID=UPI001F1ADF72|nr:glycoside hydrolase family 3 N-terminal domain-containing protein [Antarcticibacterium sp. 1MA-6-2]UJH90134.1 glycoside hydrolase family 3 [Antarcticibacterium sp. 1MA-6-2]